MSCDDRRDQMLLHAAGLLDGTEAAELLAHVDGGCARCAGSYAEAQAVLAHLPLALQPVAPQPDVRRKLMARVAESSAPQARAMAPIASRAPRPGWESWVRPAIAAGLAALVAYVAATRIVERRLGRELAQKTEEMGVQLARQALEIRRLQGEITNATRTVRLLSSPNLLLVRLEGSETQPGASGRVLWDRDQGAWHFFATGLKPTAPGRTYELWFINAAQEKIPAGTFDVGESGEGTLFVQVPEGIGTLAVTAVTDEPQGGSVQPTGSIHLVGRIEASAT